MSDTKIYHLSEDQLAKAILDPKDLSPDHRMHLNQCYQCFKQMRLLERQLISLGHAALEAAPIPQKRFQISTYQYTKEKKNIKHRFSYPVLKPVTILLAVLTLTMLGGRLFMKYNSPLEKVGMNRIAAEDMVLTEDVMNEISLLINNPLPPKYRELFEMIDISHDDDFMDFIVPAIEDESMQSDWGGMKGSFIC